MKLTIRQVAADDFVAWLPLWEDYLRFYKEDLPSHVTASTWRRFLDPQETIFAAVAIADDRFVGIVTIVLHRSTWAENYYCYLEDLFVAPDARGQGVATGLIEWVKAFAQERSCSRLYWHTHESNLPGRRLYDRLAKNLGFIEYRAAL